MTFKMLPLLEILLFFAAVSTASPFESSKVQIRSNDNSSKLWTTNSTIGMAVNTTSGEIVGHADQRFPFVSEYLGIPFAKPPVGSLAFAVPEAYEGTSRIVADKEPLSCTQEPYTPLNSSYSVEWRNVQGADRVSQDNSGEDCLYLNVWTKYPSPGAPLKPVMIYIFGGGFHSGSAGAVSEQGSVLAEEQDVVAINFNYRIGIWGFPGAPNTRQNLGLLDQRLAIEWVRDNIAQFGGDPCQITIFGHSAGGASVDLYNFAYTEDPIIAGSIPMSGTAMTFGNRYPSTIAKAWYETAKQLGCGQQGKTSDEAILACVRTKTPKELLQVSNNVSVEVTATLPLLAQSYAKITGIFGPTIDNITVFENYTQLGEEGKFIKRPILTGSNDDEGCLFAMRGQITDSEENLQTTVVFTCPVFWTAVHRTQNQVPTWKYRYFGAYPNVYASACPGRPWHGQEDLLLFDTTQIASKEPNTPIEMTTGWYIRQSWAAFAHDPENGLSSNSGWPTLNNGADNVVVLGLNQTVETVQDATTWNAPCELALLRTGAPNY